MPISKKYIAEFRTEKFYHVYNKTINKANMFYSDGDREVFLGLVNGFGSCYMNLLAFVLMDNHFHFVIKVKTNSLIRKNLGKKLLTDLTENEKKFLNHDKTVSINILLVNQFRRIFISYTRYLELRHKRSGSLFQRVFKRKFVDDIYYLRSLILYVHFNPIKHGAVAEDELYQWGSYKNNSLDQIIKVNKQLLYRIFESKTKFQAAHGDPSKYLDFAGFSF